MNAVRTRLPLRLRVLAYLFLALGAACVVASGIAAVKSGPYDVAPTERLGGHGWFVPEKSSEIEQVVALNLVAAVFFGLAAAAATAVGFRTVVACVVCVGAFCLLAIMTIAMWLVGTPPHNF